MMELFLEPLTTSVLQQMGISKAFSELELSRTTDSMVISYW